MKEEILRLKSEGKSYKEIQELLGCSKGTISYHCGTGQKEKTKNRRDKRRENIIKSKTDNFKYVKSRVKNKDKEYKVFKTKEDVNQSTRVFQKRDNTIKGRYNKNIETSFTWEDVLNKFGENTECYLSGEKINLYVNNYNFDHIIPASKGGSNTLENLGILTETINNMKTDMTPNELIEMCIKILRYNGYNVEKLK
jgi:5-methylcytosine-specific restriction endonuclease McrA